MLLNKKIKLISMSSIILIILPIAYSQQTCTAEEIKDALRKALFEFFETPSNSKLSVNEIKDLLHFYISLDTSQLVVDCSGSGPLSGKPYYLMLGAARNIQRGIPTCSDGTEYGKCSSNVPNYCYVGKLEERCKLCGCPSGKTCSATGTCLGEAVKPVESQICDRDVRITTNLADQRNPAIYWDKIVWTDYRNGIDKPYIYMYDLVTGKETQIAQGVSPAIYKDKVVWTDYRDTKNYSGYNFYGKGDIYMYDITTGKETPVSTVVGSQLAPYIYENKIVWYDYRDSNSDTDIYMYDITTGKETKIGESMGNDHSPRIHGDRVVWSVYNSNTRDWDIYMYEISTGRQTQITKGQDSEVGPDIYGDKIVWVTQYEGRTNEFPVYVYDINTRTQSRITSHSSTNFFPKINGNRVVWMDYRSGSNSNPDIYMYDLSTGKETQITTNGLSQGTPAIHDNKIVWEDNRNGNYDIYMATLSDAATGKCVSSPTPTEPIPPIQTLPNPPQITSISPSSGMPNAKITLIGTGFTLTGNYINWGNHLNAIRDLSSPDGKTLTFPALQMQCPQKTCLVSVTNENGTSNLVAFNLTHRPAKKIRKGPPTVKILTPNGGERFIFGKDRINITWSGGRNSVVLMVMQRDPWPYNEQNDFNYWLDWYIIAKDKPPSGSFEWDGKVCSWFDANDCRQVYHGFQKILALSEDKPNEQLTYETLWDPDHNNWDESDNPYLVVTPATISSLEVTSPNGEEKWIQEKSEYPSSLADIGTRAPFEWTTTGFASNGYSVPYYPTLSGQIYSVNLLKGGKFYKTMFSGFIYQYPKWSSFFYYFTFPHYVQNASDYSVEVVFHGLNGDVKDDSNNVFTIGTPPGVVAVRGRMVDRFTKSDLLPDGYFPGYSPNSFVHTGTRKDGTKFYPLYGSLFVFGMGTDDLSLATQKAQYSSYDHISNLPITIAKKPDNAFEAVIDVMDENPQPQRFNVVESDANLLTVPMWTAASLYLSTDVPVSYSVEYVKDGLTLNGSSETALKSSSPWTNYYYGLQYSYYLGRAIPLNYDTKVKLIDNTGKAYYSPNINLGLEYTNYWATLIFKNGTLKWDILPNVQVVYPNGGELLKTGTTQEIKWKYVNAPANYNPRVNIYLAGGASYLGSDYLYYYTAFSPWKLITTTQGTSYNWTIPSDTAASNYRILVRGEPYYSTNYIRDYSDNWFWISYS